MPFTHYELPLKLLALDLMKHSKLDSVPQLSYALVATIRASARVRVLGCGQLAASLRFNWARSIGIKLVSPSIKFKLVPTWFFVSA
jgi:hypothetical protein